MNLGMTFAARQPLEASLPTMAGRRSGLGLRLWDQGQRVLAALLLLLALPILLPLYPAVRLTSPGPFLYRQLRPGRQGVRFHALKIRTMSQGADKDSRLARSVRNDNPLVTPIGRVLRELKLDELPQLINVVKGEMSIVGPRPLGGDLQRELEERIPGFEQRLAVRPGLTSLAQVCVLESAEQEGVIDDWRRRFQLERHYIENRSAAYDLVIMLLTAGYILRKLMNKILKR